MAGCYLAGVKHVPLATLLGKGMIGDMRATVKERLNPHLSSVLESLGRGFASRQYPLIVTGSSCQKGKGACNKSGCKALQAEKSTVPKYCISVTCRHWDSTRILKSDGVRTCRGRIASVV